MILLINIIKIGRGGHIAIDPSQTQLGMFEETNYEFVPF